MGKGQELKFASIASAGSLGIFAAEIAPHSSTKRAFPILRGDTRSKKNESRNFELSKAKVHLSNTLKL
jgi:hypothetical protein